jgi:c(7)-type cytochrome triheme protein
MIKKTTFLFLPLVFLFLWAQLLSGSPVTGAATEEGIVYRNTKDMPPVVFSHNTHMRERARVKCRECHPRLFKIGQKVSMSMLDLLKGKYCGACHNGVKAFKVGGKGSCKKCHIRGRR